MSEIEDSELELEIDDSRECSESNESEEAVEHTNHVEVHDINSDSSEVAITLLIIPDVPKDFAEASISISGEDLDVEIRRRLTRLQFFSQTRALNKEKPFNSMKVPKDEELRHVKKDESIVSDVIDVTSDIIIARTYEKIIRSPISEPKNMNMTISIKTRDLSRETTNETQNINEDSISEALEMILATNSDISYITMANDFSSSVTENAIKAPLSETIDWIRAPTSEVQDIIKSNKFMKLQENELFTTLCHYQSYLVGLVIVCNHVSTQLAQTVEFLQSFHSETDSPSICTNPSPPSTSVTPDPGKVTIPLPRECISLPLAV